MGTFLRDQRGAVFVWFAIFLSAILAVAALAIDTSYGFFTRAKLQTVASTAALAGVELVEPEPENETAMKGLVRFLADRYANDKNAGLGLKGDYIRQLQDVEVGNWDETTDTFTADTTPYNAVRVTAGRRQDTGNPLDFLLATVLGEAEVNVRATAIQVPPRPAEEICLLALDPTEPNALNLSGDTEIRASECGVCVNSSAALAGSPALDIGEGETINMGDAGVISVHGLIEGESDQFTPQPEPFQSPCADPYFEPELVADIEPAFEPIEQALENNDCSGALEEDITIDGGTQHIVPGIHCDSDDGTIVASGEVVFDPGIHHFIGADLDLSAATSVSGTGVTLVLSDSTLNWGEAPKDTDLSPGPSGFLVYQDPATPAGTNAHTFSGSDLSDIQGVLYFGLQDIELHGGTMHGEDPSVCAVYIGRRIDFVGTVDLGLGKNCDIFLPTTGPAITVLRLVE